MSKLQTLDDAVSEYNSANPKTKLQKELEIPTLSFKIAESDDGQIIDSDSWQTETVEMKVYPEARLAGSYLTIRRSNKSDTGFEMLILRHQYIDGDHGFCVGKVDMRSGSEGIEISRSGAKKISASEAALIINAKTHWLRQRDGTDLKMPAVSIFKLEH